MIAISKYVVSVALARFCRKMIVRSNHATIILSMLFVILLYWRRVSRAMRLVSEKLVKVMCRACHQEFATFILTSTHRTVIKDVKDACYVTQ